jgi:hypothetical protein
VSPPAATKSAAHGGAKFSYFPLAYSGSARAWLGETVQLASAAFHIALARAVMVVTFWRIPIRPGRTSSRGLD